MTPFEQAAPIAITPLTPIHIGCGETFEPTDYVIDGNGLYAFDPSLAVLNDSQRSQLLRVARDADLQGIQNFFRNHPKPFIGCSKQVIPVTDEISREYDEKIGKPAQQVRNGNNIINRLSIDRTTCHPHTGIPYLPGSSLKGAIRTAILDCLNNGEKPRVPARQATQWENHLLRMEGFNFAQSAFRLLKVSDLTAGNPAHQIVMARQYKKELLTGKQQDSSTIPVRKQVIIPAQYRCFTGSINLQSLSGIHAEKKKIPAWTIENLKALTRDCNRYYLSHMERDLAVLQALQGARLVSSQWLDNFRKLLSGIQAKLDSGNAFLVKLGQYGGAESKTYTGNVAEIKIMHGKNKKPTYESSTTTIWLTDCGNGNVPFGWALVEIDPEDDLTVLKKWCGQQQASLLDNAALQQKLSEIKTEMAEKKAVIAQEKAEQEAKRQAEEQAAQQKAAELAAMSPAELLLNEIKELLGRNIKNGSTEYVKLRESILKIKEIGSETEIQEVRRTFSKDQKKQLKKIWETIKQ